MTKLPSVTKFMPTILGILVLIAAGSSPSTLRQAADRTGLLIGTAVRPYALSDAAYSETLGREFNMVEPEDAMKWWTVRRNEGFDFRDGDEIVRFAQAHGMKVRGHCLVWDHDNPKWLTQGHFTPEQLSHILQEHITTEAKHYAGQVFAWDVVNEAFDEHGRLKDSPWYNQPGIGLSAKGDAYVEQAFRWAHEADPQALLFYNEGGAESMNAKSDAVYAMLKGFKKRGVPIAGVGLQMHISRFEFDGDGVTANIDRLAALGLEVHITEFDVAAPVDSNGPLREEDLQRQADIYRRVAHACLQNPGCTTIQTWGFSDKYSWIVSHSHGTQGGALLFDKGYRPKPAFSALQEEISSAPNRRRSN